MASKWDNFDDLDATGPREKRLPGRPVENPFQSAKAEEDFVRRGQAMLQAYFKPKTPTKAACFEIDPEHSLSRTQFWTILYIYLQEDKQVKNNLNGFLYQVGRHFGTEVVPDRAGISKCVKVQWQQRETLTEKGKTLGPHPTADERAQYKFYKMFQGLTLRWKRV